MWCCSGGTQAQPEYCDHDWVVEVSRKYRAQRLRPDATNVAPGENAFFADGGEVAFDGMIDDSYGSGTTFEAMY